AEVVAAQPDGRDAEGADRARFHEERRRENGGASHRLEPPPFRPSHPRAPMRFPLAFALFALLALAACDTGDDDAVAQATDTVTVAYEGRLEDGTVFDRSDRATFPLQRVIPGFRDGIVGMRVGESKTITVPPEQGYGAAGLPPVIPPNATLIFEVTLLDIE